MRRKMEKKVIPDNPLTTSPTKAIRLKCLDCMGGVRGEVRNCGADNCALWPFRFGNNPFTTRGRNMSPEVKARQRAIQVKRWKEKKGKQA